MKRGFTQLVHLCLACSFLMLNKIYRKPKNVQSRETGNSGHKTKNAGRQTKQTPRKLKRLAKRNPPKNGA